jgi:hypothetical protein
MKVMRIHNNHFFIIVYVSIRTEGISLFFINLKNSLHFQSQNGSAVDFAERHGYIKVTFGTFHHLYMSV